MARKKPCQTGIALASHPYGNRFSTAIWQKAPHSHLADGSTGAGTAIWQAPSHLADGSTGAGTAIWQAPSHLADGSTGAGTGLF